MHTTFFDDAETLILSSERLLEEIRPEVAQALSTNNISMSLRLKVKSIFDNLKPPLDYVAKGLYFKHGDAINDQEILKKINFPIASKSQTLTSLKVKIPGLASRRPDIIQKISTYQYFHDHNNEWLVTFNNLANSAKHQEITILTKKKKTDLALEIGGIVLRLEEGAAINFTGNSGLIGPDGNIPGGQIVGVDKDFKTEGNVTTKYIDYNVLVFAHNKVEVIPLIETSINGIKKIVADLKQ